MLKTIGVGLCAASLSMNNPGGHQLLHEVGLRVAFTDAIAFAEDKTGNTLSFEEFRMFAPFYLQEYYGEDRDSFEKAINLLSLSLCFPSSLNTDDQDGPPQEYIMACHISVRHEEDEEDKLKPQPVVV